MAAVSLLVTTSDTGGTPNTSDSFDPTVGDLLVVCVSMPGTLTTTPTCTSSIPGNTFSLITAGGWPTTPDNWVRIFVADQLIASGEDIAQTVTIQDTSDQATGTNIAVLAVSGMSKTGATAVRQIGTPDNDNSAGATPTVPFAGAIQTTNPTIGAVAVLLSASAIDPPTGWTELCEIGHITPNVSLEVVARNSGSTASSLLWTSTYGQVGAAVGIELDASSSGSSATVTPNVAGMSV
jgi:hypothetical protein